MIFSLFPILNSETQTYEYVKLFSHFAVFWTFIYAVPLWTLSNNLQESQAGAHIVAHGVKLMSMIASIPCKYQFNS